MSKKRNQLLGTVLTLGVAAAGAYGAYKLRKASRENIINNFEDYIKDGCCKDGSKEKTQGKFAFIKNFIMNMNREEEELEKENPFKNTMRLRKNRVYKKTVMGINGTKY